MSTVIQQIDNAIGDYLNATERTSEAEYTLKIARDVEREDAVTILEWQRGRLEKARDKAVKVCGGEAEFVGVMTELGHFVT